MSAFPRNVTAEANNQGNMAHATGNAANKPAVSKTTVRRRLTVLPSKGGAKEESPAPSHHTFPVTAPQVINMPVYSGSNTMDPTRVVVANGMSKRPLSGPRRMVPPTMSMGGGPVYGASRHALSHPVFSNPHVLKAAPFVPSVVPPVMGSDASESGMKRYAEGLMDDGTYSEPSTLNEQPSAPLPEVTHHVPVNRASNFTAKALDDHNVRQAYVSKRILEVQKSHATPQKPCPCVYCKDSSVTTGQCVKDAAPQVTPKATPAADPTPIKEAGPATPARNIKHNNGPAPPTPMLDWTTTPTPAKKKHEEFVQQEEAPRSSARRNIFADNTPRRAFPLSTGDTKDRTPEPKHETPIASFFTRSAQHQHRQSPVAHTAAPVMQSYSPSHAESSSPTILMVVGHNGRRQPVISGRVPPPHDSHIVFEGDRGEDMGRVADSMPMQTWRASSSCTDKSLSQMTRIATPQEAQYWGGPLLDEGHTAADVCADIVRRLRLPMFVVSASFQLDRKKLTIFYESQQPRVDFRKLCVELHSTFKCRIWMERVE